MGPTSEVSVVPVAYEALQQQTGQVQEIQNVSDFAFNHLAFLSKTNPTSQELAGISNESRTSFISIQYLQELPQLENAYEEPIPVTHDAKGMLENGNDLFIQIDDTDPDARTVRPTIKPEQPDENTPLPARILTLTGSNHDNFTCVVETGAGEKRIITVPRQVVEDAQVLSQQTEILAGITDENTRKVVQSHIDSLMGTVGPSQVDQQTLREAAKSSGQVTTQSLSQFVEMASSEKPEDSTYTEKRNAIREKLSNHTVATKEDFIEVLTFVGPEKVASIKKNIQSEIDSKRELLKGLNTPETAQERTRIQGELNKLQSNLDGLANAEEFYTDPKNFENFLDVMSSGKLSKEQALLIGQHFENGEMVKAMQEMAKAKIETLTPEQTEKLHKIFGMKPSEAFLAASGGTLLLLIMLMINGLNDANT